MYYKIMLLFDDVWLLIWKMGKWQIVADVHKATLYHCICDKI